VAPQKRLATYRPQTHYVRLFEREPWALTEALEDWWICASEEATNALEPGWTVEPIPQDATDLLMLWCDLHPSSIDPTPLNKLTDLLFTIRHPMVHVHDPDAPGGIRTERTPPPSRADLDACLRECKIVIDRLRRAASVLLSQQSATSSDTALRRVRDAIAKLGKDSKADCITKEAGLSRRACRQILRQLEKRGEYTGFAHKKPSRYEP